MSFKLPLLPYDYGALGRSISREVMQLHHDKHHQTYVDKLNLALDGQAKLADKSIEDLIKNLNNLPENIRQAVRNNGGGHLNHSLFWQWMSPQGGGQPSGKLGQAISEQYGSFQSFVDEYSEAAAGLFGSGWVWLNRDLSITTSPNQDNPLSDGHDLPILGLDVWEHAYYLDYKNVRADYIKAWWDVVNWDQVSQNYSA